VACDNLHCVIAPCTAEMLTHLQHMHPERPGNPDLKRSDGFWFGEADFAFYTAAPPSLSESQMPNTLRPLELRNGIAWDDDVLPAAPVDPGPPRPPTPEPEQEAPQQPPAQDETVDIPLAERRYSEKDFAKLVVAELKKLAQAHGLTTKGLRADLRDRLRTAGIVDDA
jgi:hypothetical protein